MTHAAGSQLPERVCPVQVKVARALPAELGFGR
jgi:hypothetical protein